MKIKKMILAVMLIIVMTLPQIAHATPDNSSEMQGGKTTSTVQARTRAKKGWVTESGKIRYYLNNSTYVKRSWRKINKRWYYFDKKGYVATGWRKISGKIYYLKKTGNAGNLGRMLTGWRTIDNNRYYFDKSGHVITGWKKLNGKWYHFKKSSKIGTAGRMLTGWQRWRGNRIYFNSSGHLLTGRQTIDGVSYYFQKTGTPNKGGLGALTDITVVSEKKAIEVCRKIIYAVETGGQVYGNCRYDDFTEAYHNTPSEHAITIGAGQWYATEARRLLLLIRKTDKKTFEKLDTAGIGKDLDNKKINWSTYKLKKKSKKAKCIVKIINSEVGRKCQDELMDTQIKEFFATGRSLGLVDTGALIEFVNVAHLGGVGTAKKVVETAKKPYTAETMNAAILKRNTGNQVGAKLYRTRHAKVLSWIKKYIYER